MNNIQHSNTVMRREDDRLITGQGAYTDDFDHPGALHAVFVRSPYVCGTIRSIDTSAALAMPGVSAVLTGADMLASGFNSCPAPYRQPQGDGSFASETPRPYLAIDQVRFAGEPVAMVLADSEMAAMDAAELVLMDLEEREAVVEVDAAVERTDASRAL